MTAAKTGLVVAVVGLPKAGKTTVAKLVAAEAGGQCRTLTDLAHAARHGAWPDLDVPTERDTNGVLDEADTHRILRAALTHNLFPATGPLTLLDDVVRSSHALHILAEATPHPADRLRVIELDTRQTDLIPRANLQSVDDTHRFIDLLTQYRDQQPGLIAAARQLRIPWRRINATLAPDKCAANALAALTGAPVPLRLQQAKPPAPRDPTP